MEQKTKQENKPKKPVVNPGKCPSCGGVFFVEGKGFFCGQCGYVGWFTYDQYFED
jgi:ribosomal protein S27AE